MAREEVVGELILISYHVVVLDTVEFPFNFSNFSAVCVHFFTRTGPILIELVDNQRGIPVYHEAFDAELDGYMETMETCFVFHRVVGGRKVYVENIPEFILGRRNKQNSRTSTVDVKGAIKVHHPVLGAGGSNGFLDLGPLSDEVSKRL